MEATRAGGGKAGEARCREACMRWGRVRGEEARVRGGGGRMDGWRRGEEMWLAMQALQSKIVVVCTAYGWQVQGGCCCYVD